MTTAAGSETQDVRSVAKTVLTVADVREKAEKTATRVLDEHWHESTFPVSPYRIANSEGLTVYEAHFDDDTSGMLIGTSSKGYPDIYIEARQPPARKRFTCAHELGHHFDDENTPLRVGEAFIHHRNEKNARTRDEVFANHFAGALLMPHQEVRSLHTAGTDIFDMADYFGVSTVAMRYRISLLKL